MKTTSGYAFVHSDEIKHLVVPITEMFEGQPMPHIGAALATLVTFYCNIYGVTPEDFIDTVKHGVGLTSGEVQ